MQFPVSFQAILSGLLLLRELPPCPVSPLLAAHFTPYFQMMKVISASCHHFHMVTSIFAYLSPISPLDPSPVVQVIALHSLAQKILAKMPTG